MPEDTCDPASILHVHGHVQSEHVLERFAVHLGADEFILAQHCVYSIAGDEAHRKKDQDAQDEQGRHDQQQPPDDVGLHGRLGVADVLGSALESDSLPSTKLKPR